MLWRREKPRHDEAQRQKDRFDVGLNRSKTKPVYTQMVISISPTHNIITKY